MSVHTNTLSDSWAQLYYRRCMNTDVTYDDKKRFFHIKTLT